MGARIEWAELGDNSAPILEPEGSIEDDHGNTNDDWALYIGDGAVLEGSLERWSKWAAKLTAEIHRRTVEEAAEEEREPRRVRVIIQPGDQMLEFELVEEETQELIRGEDAERIVDVWAGMEKRTAEWYLESDAILGWVGEDGLPRVAVWSETEDGLYDIDAFPHTAVTYEVLE